MRLLNDGLDQPRLDCFISTAVTRRRRTAPSRAGVLAAPLPVPGGVCW
jgi:hypothetical protein